MDAKVVKSKPLSKEETKALLELIENSKIITSKTTNATSNKLKEEEWYRITEKFNATATSSRRLPQQLRLKWENLKKNARKRSTKIRMNNIKTGGGVRDYIPPDEVLDRVSNLLGTTASGFVVQYGGDKEPETFDVRTSDGECGEDGSGMEEMGGDAHIDLEILGFQDAPMLDPEVMILTPKNISEPGTLPDTPRRVTFNIPKAKAEARHSMHRRETDYDIFAADEASDDEPQNDEYEERSPESKNQPPEIQAKITTKSRVYEVTSGDDVRLECNVDPDNGTVAQWYKGSDLYFMNTMKTFFDRDLSRYSIVPDSKDLLIRAVDTSDAGVFKCEVAQTSPVSVEHTIVMLESPKIARFTATNDGNVVEGEDLLLTCEVIGRPPPQIVWSRAVENGNERLGEQDGEFSQNSVYMKDVKREHAGKYYCYAFNKVGSNQAELEVSIAGKPRVHVHKTVVNSAINVEAVLQCSAHHDDNVHIHWYKDGKLIEDSSTEFAVSTHGIHSNLTVVPDADDDFGTFTCEAENNIGKHNKSIELVQRPVVESFEAVEGKLAWTVHSHRPLQEIHAQIKPFGGNGEWKQFNIPLPSTNKHRYEIVFDLNDKALDAGKYEALVKVRNDHSWSDPVEPVDVEIDVKPPTPIQHASVFRGGSNAHSIRPSSVILSTILMYLLVRAL